MCPSKTNESEKGRKLPHNVKKKKSSGCISTRREEKESDKPNSDGWMIF